MEIDDKQEEVKEVKQNRPFKVNELFGGAIKISLPDSFRNMEDKVPIPDSQEIFQDMSDFDAGQFFIEIQERNEQSDNDAIGYVFNDLAECNRSEKTKINQIQHGYTGVHPDFSHIFVSSLFGE